MKNYLLTLLTSLVVLAGMPALATTAVPGTYGLDKSHTNIGFRVSHMGISFVVGRFNDFQGSFKFEPNGDSSASFSIDVNSIDTNNARRDGHLKTADFFDVASFPRMTFESTRVTYDEAGNPATIEGELTLHGQTNPVVLKVSTVGTGVDQLGRTHSGFHATTTILRSEYGMDKLLLAAGDEVEIIIDIEGVVQ
tara:strand:- start:22900 stop:23481 length:582 start_codon:yes stop_codon:yes gene_type:complete